MKLSTGDRLNPLWAKLLDMLNERLAELRALNDAKASEIDTAYTRGRIAEVKALLSLDEDDPVIHN